MVRFLVLGMSGVLCLVGCRSQPPANAEGPSCEQRKSQLMNVLTQLPKQSLATPIKTELANSAIGGTFGEGPVLTIAEPNVSVSDAMIPGDNRAERSAHLLAHLNSLPRRALEGERVPLYVAARADVDIQTLHDYLESVPQHFDLRLLFATPSLVREKSEDRLNATELDIPDRVLSTRDPQLRHTLASEGYRQYAGCGAVHAAADKVAGLPAAQRWPQLLVEMQSAIPGCACSDLDPDGLRRLLVAEQRAGTLGLGSVTANYLRDVRCRASMPLDSVQQLLDEIDAFDAEFAGSWREDALVFDRVMTDDRLLVYLCVATPGEVLAALQRESGSVYWRVPGHDRCQEWRFEPIARGAPMGSLRRVAPLRSTISAEPVSKLHYRQAGSELRIFGPADGEDSRATDSGPWRCDQEIQLEQAEAARIQLKGGGAWFFDRGSCQQAARTVAQFDGCVARAAAGEPVPELPAPEPQVPDEREGDVASPEGSP